MISRRQETSIEYRSSNALNRQFVSGQFDDAPEEEQSPAASCDYHPQQQASSYMVSPHMLSDDDHSLPIREVPSSYHVRSRPLDAVSVDQSDKSYDSHSRLGDHEVDDDDNRNHELGGFTSASSSRSASPTTTTTTPTETTPIQNTSSDDASNPPTECDVLCGRGGKTNNHNGNKEFRLLIDLYREDYFAARKPKKTEISLAIVSAIRNRGGRFLKYDRKTKSWNDIGDSKALEKTSQALREGAAQRLRKILKGAQTLSPQASPAITSASAPVQQNLLQFDDDFRLSSSHQTNSYPTAYGGMEDGRVVVVPSYPPAGGSCSSPPSQRRNMKKRWLADFEMEQEEAGSDGMFNKRQRSAYSA